MIYSDFFFSSFCCCQKSTFWPTKIYLYHWICSADMKIAQLCVFGHLLMFCNDWVCVENPFNGGGLGVYKESAWINLDWSTLELSLTELLVDETQCLLWKQSWPLFRYCSMALWETKTDTPTVHENIDIPLHVCEGSDCKTSK